jgi:hypothetical protein
MSTDGETTKAGMLSRIVVRKVENANIEPVASLA